ncbi:MAG: hypothetical protein ACHQQQ_12030, partial [Bacteroidota bacterium]
ENGYVQSESLSQGVGYWMKLPEGILSDTVIHFAGTGVVEETLMVTKKWNLIGSLSVPVAVMDLIEVPNGMFTSSFYGYDGSYQAADTLYPGRGYWVKSAGEGKLILRRR